MKPGDVAEVAIWLSGTETDEDIERWKTTTCRGFIAEEERRYGVEIGPLEFTIKHPGEDRVPQVPDHISGPDVRLLVGEAKVIAGMPRIERATGFVHDLTNDDLEHLRTITRRAHARAYPGERLTDAQCDGIIEALGPDAAVKTLREGASLN